MKNKVSIILVLIITTLSLTACGKEQATGLEVVPEFGNTETVSEVEEVKEVSLLEGQSYRVSLNMKSGASIDTSVNYTKAVSGNEYSYTLGYANALLGQSQAYCNGTDLYVYTNVSPTGASLDEYIWIRNGANPFEQIENDIFSAIVQSNIDKLMADGIDAVDFIDYMPYLKSLGYEEIILTSLNEELTSFSFDLGGMQTGGAILQIFIENTSVVVPDITDCKEVTDFNSSAEQLSGNGVITEEDYANHLVDGYYLADGTFSYSESKEQSWEHYIGGVLIASYDYNTDTYIDIANSIVVDNYMNGTDGNSDEEDDIVYAGENSANYLDATILGVPFTLDNTRADIECVSWYGEIKEDVYFEDMLYNCKDEVFSNRFDEVFNTFSIRYMVENYDKFDRTTQMCVIGMTDYCNFSIDGQTTFKDMLIANGVEIDQDMLNEFWLLVNGNATLSDL